MGLNEDIEARTKPCFYCGELTQPWAGNPGLWPIVLPQNQMPEFHHVKCVKIRLDLLESILCTVKDSNIK